MIAIGIWVYIALVMSIPQSRSRLVTCRQFIGGESLNSRGFAVISESATTVTVKIKGSRKKMGNNDMKTIIAKADISSITETGETNIPMGVVYSF